MHIPSVTDEMLAKVLQHAVSPVVVEWTHAGCRDAKRMRRTMELAASAYDDRLIFLRIWIEEHPTMAAARSIAQPCLEVWRRGELFATADEGWEQHELEAFFEQVVERADRARGA